MTVAASLNTAIGVAVVADVRLTPATDPNDGHDICQKLFVLGPSAAIAFSGEQAEAGRLLKTVTEGRVRAGTSAEVDALPDHLTKRFRASYSGRSLDPPAFLLATASPSDKDPAFSTGRVYTATAPEFNFVQQPGMVTAIGSGAPLFSALAKDDPNLSFRAMQYALADVGCLCQPLANHFYRSKKDSRVGGLLVEVVVQPGRSTYVQRAHSEEAGAWSMSFDQSGRGTMMDLSSGRTVRLRCPWQHLSLNDLEGPFGAMEEIMAPRRAARLRTPAGGNHLVFDWHEAARRIRDRRPRVARAGLEGLEHTWGAIYRDGGALHGYDREPTVLESSTHVPTLELDEERRECWATKPDRPYWNGDSTWPEDSIDLLMSGRAHATFSAGSTHTPQHLVLALKGVAESDPIGCRWHGCFESKDGLLRVTMTHLPPDPEDKERPPFMRREQLEWVSEWGTPEALVAAFRDWMAGRARSVDDGGGQHPVAQSTVSEGGASD